MFVDNDGFEYNSWIALIVCPVARTEHNGIVLL